MSDVPRVARSVDDLRVGMVVAWYLPIGMPLVDGGYVEDVLAGSANIRTRADASKVLYASDFDYGQVVVILADAPDPPARDWLVPATQMEALREELRHLDACTCGADPLLLHGFDIKEHARAVLDAAREVEHE